MVSHERIYQYIAQDKKKGGELYKHLRRRKKYKRRCVVEDRRGKLANTKLGGRQNLDKFSQS